MVFEDLLTGVRFLTSAQIPPELALKVIQSLPFGNGKRLAALRSCHSSLADLFATYEYSLTNWFMEKELRHAPTDFPYSKSFGLKWLGECVHKYDIVDEVMDEMCWRDNCMAVEPHNQTLVYAGLLLLYRLAELPDSAFKLAFITSLPLDPLTAIYVALHHATLTARYHGSGWINQRTYGRFMDANQLALRNELEFSFAEASLSTGPEFLHDMLVNPCDPSGEATLLIFYHEHGSRKWDWPCWGDGSGEFKPPRTQGPMKEDGKKEKALFTAMLERMAGLVGCATEEVRTRIELDTDEKYHELANLDMYNKARLVSGLDAVVD